MRATTRLLIVSSTVITLVLSGSVAAAQPAGVTVSAGGTAIDWVPCEEDPSAECGTLSVPIDWERPGGERVELALARRPATDPAARIGSLVINPGGPGGSGVDFALVAPDYFSKEILSRFDVVGFDPRGVARSHPVVCSVELLEEFPSPLVTSQAEFEALVAYNTRLGEDCRAHTGPLFDHLDTLSVVRDIDAIRAAVGDDQLSYYGLSYGTLMGQQYAEEFPHRVRALGLDSNMDHSLGTRAFLATETVSAQDSFDEFVAWCDREPRCALHGEDVRALWADLLDRAARGELDELTVVDLVGIAFGAFYGPAWFALADFLLALATDQPPPVALAADAGGAQEDEVAPNPTQAVFCQDWALPVRDYREYRQHLRRMTRIAPDMRFPPAALSVTAACLGWPAEVSNPQHRLRVPPGPELLLANALHDPVTGYNWAVNAARQLRRSAVLLTYEGWGHGVYGRSDCLTGAFDDYLVSLTLPERGARCPAVPPEPPEATQGLPVPPDPLVPVPTIPGYRSSDGF
jgi:pimeloyl-ACP methyl ester carboxylesterase